MEGLSQITLSNNIGGAAAPVSIFGNARAVSISVQPRYTDGGPVDRHSQQQGSWRRSRRRDRVLGWSLAGHAPDNITTQGNASFGHTAGCGVQGAGPRGRSCDQGGVAGCCLHSAAFDDGGALPTISGTVALAQFSSLLSARARLRRCPATRRRRKRVVGPDRHEHVPGRPYQTGMTGPGHSGPRFTRHPGIPGCTGHSRHQGPAGIATTQAWSAVVTRLRACTAGALA